ncbi:MAG: tetratricopeptide repeat protein, partial [Deltaproteobacteria bacterium]|nr:tetratricopeptide repeat protein [Deltaproteobacteria bacterium]
MSDFEKEASEAEKNNLWEEAARAYTGASRESRTAGQLQKAMAYGNKAMEIGEKIKHLGIQGAAIFQLAINLRQLGQEQKARELLLKGIEITKPMLPGPAKEITQANLYSELGFSFMRQGKHSDAIDHISYAVSMQESVLSFFKTRRPPNPGVVPRVQGAYLSALFRLGTAYTQAGNTEEAIKTFERGIAFIQETGQKNFLEANLLWGLGSAYSRKKELPRALETLTKALKTAENFQNEVIVQNASGQLGNLLLQTGRPSEAVSHFKRAIDSVESVRSLLESEEFRSSFFEDKRRLYAGMIVAQLRAGNPEEAFNYSERARSRAFLDILGSKVQLARSGTLLEHERALQARIGVLRAMMAEQGAGGTAREQLQKEFEEAQKSYNDFLTKLRSENKEQASLMNVEPFTLKQVQEQ